LAEDWKDCSGREILRQIIMQKYNLIFINKARIIYGLLSFLSLFLGMSIYLIFRDKSNMILFEWLPKFNFSKNVFIPLNHSGFNSIFLFNLPDMLWFLSGIFFLRFIWFYKYKEQNVYILCFYLYIAIFEISQLSNNIPGTFDCLDLLFMGIGAFVEGLIYNIFVRWRFV